VRLSRKVVFFLGVGAGVALTLGLGFHKHPDLTRNTDTQIENAYRVVSGTGRTYVVEHKGHRFTANCRASLSWLDGTDEPGGPMTDGDCTYMDSAIGKTIGDDLMRKEHSSLVYSPWTGADTVQTADFLTIIDDEPIKE
jgi:hypothetical protein